MFCNSVQLVVGGELFVCTDSMTFDWVNSIEEFVFKMNGIGVELFWNGIVLNSNWVNVSAGRGEIVDSVFD